MKEVSVIGEGAWGSAIAILLADNGYKVRLWCHDREVKKSIEEKRRNDRYLPGIDFSENIAPSIELSEVITEVDWIFEAIPVKFLRTVLLEVKPFYKNNQKWIILSKGIEQGTLLLPSQILQDVLGDQLQYLAMLGPSYAKDLVEKEITAVSVAAPNCELGYQLQTIVANDYFRPYLTLDLMGVQIGGALKNVLALGIGMMDGAGYGDNAKSFLLTRGLHEMVQFCVALGGRQETMYGLAGVGDLVLTAMGSLSRNREVGKRLGSGQTLDDILKKTGYVPEGINTVQSINQLIEKKKLDLPILYGIYQIIFEDKRLDQFIQGIMNRPLEAECEF